MTIAELAGIKDMYCKVEGRTKNYLSVTKAFFNGLNSQVSIFSSAVFEENVEVLS